MTLTTEKQMPMSNSLKGGAPSSWPGRPWPNPAAVIAR